jgi:DinB superfamily
MSNQAVETFRAIFKQSHEVLENTLADVDATLLNWQPPGIANSIGANYAHIVTGEDFLVNALMRQGAPLLASSWADKTGLSEMPPIGGGMHEWGQRVQIDLTVLRAYAQAVYASTDEYLASLTDADLQTTLQTQNFGTPTVGWFLGGIVLANLNWHTGEIACLKGVQGKKGYPF